MSKEPPLLAPPRHVRPLRSEVLHFFDANLFILPPALLPALKHVPQARRWVTETVRNEVIEHLGAENAEASLRGYKTLMFDDLYRENARVCPVFYYSVMGMLLPANVGAEDFAENEILARIAKGTVSDTMMETYRVLRRRSSTTHTNDPDGNPKTDLHKRLDRIATTSKRKFLRALRDGHQSAARDAKTMALMLYQAASTRQNLIFYTADADSIHLLLKWVDSITMRVALESMALRPLRKTERAHAQRGGWVDFSIDAAEFFKVRQRLHFDFLRDAMMLETGCRFTIKQWLPSERRFAEDIYVVFSEETADALTDMHGSKCCPTTINDNYGNWARIRYHWPPAPGYEGRLRVEVRAKEILNHAVVVISPEEHNRICSYQIDDAHERLGNWNDFV